MPRPKKEIDQHQFEKLCELQCTKEEIAGFFDCSPDTIENWCKATYKESFSAVFAKKREAGKISLRRAQFELAKKNASMAIFLGKNWLGQKDQREIKAADNGILADLIDGLKITDDIHKETAGTDAVMADE